MIEISDFFYPQLESENGNGNCFRNICKRMALLLLVQLIALCMYSLLTLWLGGAENALYGKVKVYYPKLESESGNVDCVTFRLLVQTYSSVLFALTRFSIQ